MGFIEPAATTEQQLHFHIFYKKGVKNYLQLVRNSQYRIY